MASMFVCLALISLNIGGTLLFLLLSTRCQLFLRYVTHVLVSPAFFAAVDFTPIYEPSKISNRNFLHNAFVTRDHSEDDVFGRIIRGLASHRLTIIDKLTL